MELQANYTFKEKIHILSKVLICHFHGKNMKAQLNAV